MRRTVAKTMTVANKPDRPDAIVDMLYAHRCKLCQSWHHLTESFMNLKTPEVTRIKACSRFAGKLPNLLASVGFAALMLVSAPASAQVLGTASNFAVLAGTPNVTNTGSTIVSGSVGVWPAASVTGFPPGTIVPGSGFFHLADAVAQQAQSDTTAAYNTLAGLAGAGIAPGLGGQSLTPGVYSAGAADLTGVLTLNGPGLYIIQATSLTTASGPGASSVNLNGASPCDLWWQIGSSANIGTFSAMQGNILALTSITLGTSASLNGRALARNGTVTLAGNNVTACAGSAANPGFQVPPLAPVLPRNVVDTPTLSEWAMILLTGLLAIGGFVAMRRKQRQSTRLL